MSHSSDRNDTSAVPLVSRDVLLADRVNTARPDPRLAALLEGMSHPDGMDRASEISLCIGGHFELDATPPGIRSMREIVGAAGGCDLLAVAGKGLLPVPTAEVLVRSIVSNVDRPDIVGEGDELDKCCGCGGCDKSQT